MRFVTRLKNNKPNNPVSKKLFLVDILCVKCGERLLVCNEDVQSADNGAGNIFFIKNIFYPAYIERLKSNLIRLDLSDLESVWCLNCRSLIASPIKSADGQWALRLFLGTYFKQKHKADKQ
jgi:hypothetical protein